MTVLLSCSELGDLAAEAALDLLPGDERALVFEHLECCAACRNLVDSYMRVADALLVSLPQVQVPESLSIRLRSVMPSTGRSPRSFARHLLSAAAVIAALALVLVGVRVVSTHSYGRAAEAGALVSASSGRVGSVELGGGTDPWISMDIDGSNLADGTYSCEVLLTRNTTVPIGKLTIVDGNGWWKGPLKVDPARILVIRVVDSTGNVVAVGGLDAAAADES